VIRNEKNIIKQAHLTNLDKLSKLTEFPEIRHLILFGSFATGQYTVFSDIDLAYIANEPLSFTLEAELLYHLNKLLGTDEVDLINFAKAPIALQYKILSEGKIIFSDDPYEIALLKEKIFPVYFDFNYYQNEYRLALKNSFQGT